MGATGELSLGAAAGDRGKNSGQEFKGFGGGSAADPSIEETAAGAGLLAGMPQAAAATVTEVATVIADHVISMAAQPAYGDMTPGLVGLWATPFYHYTEFDGGDAKGNGGTGDHEYGTKISLGGAVFTFGDTDADGAAIYNGAATTLNADIADKAAFKGGLGLKAESGSGFSFGLDYSILAGSKETDHSVAATLRYEF